MSQITPKKYKCDKCGHIEVQHIYAKDLNGDSLDTLTPELLKELEINLIIECDDRPEVEIAGIRHDLQRAKDRLFCARWAAVKREKFTFEEATEINEKLKEIEADIRELRVTTGANTLP